MKEQKFTIPHMILHRGDLEFFDTEKDNISQSLTDDQMMLICKKISENLCTDWDRLILDIKENYPELFKKED
jgi:hypothetical protein